MLRAIRVAAITGSTISAAIRRMPTIRIETATVVAASTARTTFRNATGTPGDARALLVERDRGERAVEERDRRQPADPQGRDECEVGAGRRQDRAEEKAEEVDVERAGHRDQDDAGRDARVEDERERLVAGRVLAGAQPLDRTGSADRGDQRGQHRRQPEQVPGGDSREGDVADPVADQAELALDEEEADRRREQADDRAGGEGEPHELEVKHG